ncbi:interleukin-4 isoform X2 [Hippopotamus amphibius kiboko]|uniref:interleukin-4 isoform X2 n=1 Tax=Hippopotamus amphibius kiboko TaxID=575201 RepID=UPI002596F3D2|nr:interleukin-4 isoform X2 [Hippopotamus amphibius kiboko]
MGLTSQLIPVLVCLLACTSNFIHGHKHDITLQEIIKTLNILTARKNTTKKETFCMAATVLRQVYRQHNCLNKLLSGLDRNLSSMADKTCSVNESKKSTLKDFLERLKTIMKEKYSKC